jgi:DNA-binding CsgD family transcriptional regulator
MSRPDEIPDLIDAIYDAGLDPTLWNKAVVGIRDFVGGQACGLFSKDSISKFGVTHYYCGADPHYIQLYSETHSRFDPLTHLPEYGQIVSIPDLVNFEEYRRGRFYQEWMKPQGCSDAANVVLEKSRSDCPVLMTVLSGKRMVDAEMRKRLAIVVPHASRALMINRAIEDRISEAAAFADILNSLNAGVFLVGRCCRVIHANTAGQAMLAADDVLRSVAGQLVTRSAEANQALREAFRSGGDAIRVAAGSGAIPLMSHHGERYVAHILPLASVMRHGVDRSLDAVGALLVRKVGLIGQSYGEAIAKAFALTPTELRVLLSIVEVGGVPETAQHLGIAETTVKTHLHRVFAKTGASRQADLAKLAAGFSNPFVS